MIEEIEGTFGTKFIVITREDGSSTWIPKDETNSDYQSYLRSLNGEDEASGTLS